MVEDDIDVRIYPDKFDVGVWSDLAFEYKGRLRIIMTENPGVRFRKQPKEDLPKTLYALFCRYEQLAREAAESGEEKV